MNQDEVEVSKNSKRMRSIYVAILTEQAWSIKGYGQKGNFFLAGQMREIPSWQDRRILPTQAASQNGGLTSSVHSRILPYNYILVNLEVQIG